MKTCNLQLSRELKKAGFSQITAKFAWVQHKYKGGSRYQLEQNRDSEDSLKYDYAAPTADEILDLLPAAKKGLGALRIHKMPGGYVVGYWKLDENWWNIWTEITDISLPNALAKLWLYLKKENLI